MGGDRCLQPRKGIGIRDSPNSRAADREGEGCRKEGGCVGPLSATAVSHRVSVGGHSGRRYPQGGWAVASCTAGPGPGFKSRSAPPVVLCFLSDSNEEFFEDLGKCECMNVCKNR
jgi:hypothetical protein